MSSTSHTPVGDGVLAKQNVGDGALAKQNVGDGVLDIPLCSVCIPGSFSCRGWRPRPTSRTDAFVIVAVFSVGDGVLDVPHRYVCIPEGIFISDGILCYKRRGRHPREVRRGTRLPTSRKSKNPSQ